MGSQMKCIFRYQFPSCCVNVHSVGWPRCVGVTGINRPFNRQRNWFPRFALTFDCFTIALLWAILDRSPCVHARASKCDFRRKPLVVHPRNKLVYAVRIRDVCEQWSRHNRRRFVDNINGSILGSMNFILTNPTSACVSWRSEKRKIV